GVYCSGERGFGAILGYYGLINVGVYCLRGGQRVLFALGDLGKLFFDNFVAQLDAVIASVGPWACDELSYLFLGFTTERTLQQICRFSDSSHIFSLCALPVQHKCCGAYSPGGCAKRG